MTPEQLREAAAVMLAAADGKVTERRYRARENVAIWESNWPHWEWNFDLFQYRIKPEPLRVPVRLYKHCTTSEIKPFNLLTPIPIGFEPVSSAVDIEVKE